jgi:hypothetical protein
MAVTLDKGYFMSMSTASRGEMWCAPEAGFEAFCTARPIISHLLVLL